MSPTWKRPSPPPVDGEIRLDDRVRAAAADDFGHLVHRTPEGVLLPRSDDDVAATLPQGLTPAGLPDYLDLPVGGTLVVGGVGSAISRFGALSDNVLDLRVVTGRESS